MLFLLSLSLFFSRVESCANGGKGVTFAELEEEVGGYEGGVF